jgi:MFS superfamily sulfate permease-like transporter
MHDVDDYPEARTIPGLVVYRYDAPLCFANADDFHRRALAAARQQPEPLRWFVLNVKANVEVDFTALEALDTIREEVTGQGAVFALARVKQDLLARLQAFGLGRQDPDRPAVPDFAHRGRRLPAVGQRSSE